MARCAQWRRIGATLCVFCLAGCGSTPEPVVEEPMQVVEHLPEPPPPDPDPIALAAFESVTLKPGDETIVQVVVQRHGNEGEIQVAAGPLPEGVRVKAEPIGADESSTQLVVAADLALGDQEWIVSIPVSVKLGEQTASQPFELRIVRLSLPVFVPVSEVLLQPGQRKILDLEIQREGFVGPLVLSAGETPDAIACRWIDIAEDQDRTKLEITAASNAKDGTYSFSLVSTLYGREISVQIPVKVENRPFHVDAFRVVTLAPGETQRIEVPVQRQSYSGQFQLRAEALPDGVVIRETTVAPDSDSVTLEITAPADALQRVASSKIVSTANHLTSTGAIVIRVAGDDPEYLPHDVVANPEIRSLLRRGSIGGRLTSESKQALLDFYGGTAESEAAVMRGLRWLAAHQQTNGSWNLKDYGAGIANCDCVSEFEKGAQDCTTAGTAFGILPFLGAGVTHTRAPKDPPVLESYMPVVERGLIFLARNQVRSKDNKDGFLGGSMYAHAIATLALCEAYGLSRDDRLRLNAQLAIKYLLNAQHEAGGGWRYNPGQAGDMSVTAWVFLAIRSAQLSGIDVLKPPLTRAARFVDSCAAGPEDAKMSRYAYQPGQAATLTMTAAGLLTRQYLGWGRDHPDLIAGTKYLMENLPPESGNSLGQIYYYYHATQVLHHMEGPEFDLWNYRMREHLIRTQEQSGHQVGSWNPQGTDRGERGGRMYATAMSLLTLQVYYRHLPMYRPVRRI